MFKPITLTPDEQKIVSQIKLDMADLTDGNDVQRNGDAVVELTTCLTRRKAIPEPRTKYFLDPKYNPRSRGRSRKSTFEKNGCLANEILRHPHFLEYLSYFLFGPRLPQSVIDGFEKEVAKRKSVSSGDVGPLRAYSRQQTRFFGLNPHEAAEEFFKLAIDCNLSPTYSDIIRDAVKSIK
ncbi:MAG TPA: hypothetical protein VMF53_01765 [Alphaproteobacteria bacterium]|nr:hypothetical protein [Alphaproteobacteria bacterium]